MLFIYHLSLRFYSILIHIAAALGKTKAKQWVAGRKNIFVHMEEKMQHDQRQSIWFHFASLGEFEQGRPLLEKLYAEKKAYKIIITFFSPSGFEIRKNFSQADFIFYLPMDSKKNARKLLQLFNPALAIFTKYEFWYHYFDELKKAGTPLYMISSIFRKEQIFFTFYGGLYRDILKKVSHFFVQDKNSEILLQSLGLENVSISGDTRFDRVFENKETAKSISYIEKSKDNRKVIVAGSTWSPDEEILLRFISEEKKHYKLILAPHEISIEKINNLKRKFESQVDVILFSQINEDKHFDVLIIDNIGMLSSLYQYADIAYVGGGFGAGIHNILEAIVFGPPVIFGPNYEKFREAHELIKKGTAFSISDFESFYHLIRNLEDEKKLASCKEINLNYIEEHRGATQKILKHLSIIS